jgi:hypothetical protein
VGSWTAEGGGSGRETKGRTRHRWKEIRKKCEVLLKPDAMTSRRGRVCWDGVKEITGFTRLNGAFLGK